jgi:hypothetical protein
MNTTTTATRLAAFAAALVMTFGIVQLNVGYALSQAPQGLFAAGHALPEGRGAQVAAADVLPQAPGPQVAAAQI